MSPRSSIVALLFASLCSLTAAAAGPAAAAASAPAVAPPAPGAQPAPAGEPAVRRDVIEDDNARVEELRVRGAVRSITVQPKGPVKAEYEVIPLDAGRDSADGPGSAKGGAGRRVWRVLTF